MAIDVSNDGLPDLILSGLPVTCALGQGGGIFGPFASSTPPSSLYFQSWLWERAADFDGDGNLDLFGSYPTGLHALLGDGAGNFTPSPPMFAGSSTMTDIGDLDNDGIPEVVGITGSATALTITAWSFVGGAWTPWAFLWNFPGVSELVIGDFDGDGWRDIAVRVLVSAPGAPGTYTYVLKNSGAGQGFAITGPLPDVGPYMTVADVNNDGCDDILTLAPLVCLGHPQQLLSPPLIQSFPSPTSTLIHSPGLISGGAAPRLADVNLDGNLDWIWVASAFSGTPTDPLALQIRVLLGNGDGTFGPDFDEDEALSGAATANVGIADADGDGDPDLIFAKNLCASFAPCGAEWSIAWNDTILGAGTAGSGGLVPRLDLPSAPFPGNAGFRVDLSQAWPLDAAFLALSMAPSVGSFPGNWWLDLNQLVLPTTSIGATMTNSVGDASFPTPIPPDTVPGVRGLEVYIQWAVRDPAGSFTTNGIDSFAFSNARKIVVW